MTELLVGLTVASIVVVAVGTGFVWVTKSWTDTQMRLQTQQSLRSALETINREVRLAGVCMPAATQPPITNDFQPISGTHGTTDTITVTSNPACAGPANVTVACNQCTSISVDNVSKFTAGMWAYIYDSSTGTTPPGPIGEYFLIQSVTVGTPPAGTIAVSPVKLLLDSYPAPSGTPPQPNASVWGADQRVLAISSTCTGCNGVPSLTLALLGGTLGGQALVRGNDTLSVQYVLNRLYSTAPTECNGQTGGTSSLCVVNLPTVAPSIAGDWQIVRAMIFTVGARSLVTVRGSGSADGYFHLSETFEVSPRNLIYQQTRLPWTPY
jgi:hypothetical protein